MELWDIITAVLGVTTAVFGVLALVFKGKLENWKELIADLNNAAKDHNLSKEEIDEILSDWKAIWVKESK